MAKQFVIYTPFSDIYGNENIDRRIAKMFSKLHRAVQREIEVRYKLTEVSSKTFCSLFFKNYF